MIPSGAGQDRVAAEQRAEESALLVRRRLVLLAAIVLRERGDDRLPLALQVAALQALQLHLPAADAGAHLLDLPVERPAFGRLSG